MAKITRIKASDGPKKAEKPEVAEAPIVRKKVSVKDPKVEKKKAAEKRKVEKAAKAKDDEKKPFVLIRPFVYFGRYLRDSWREIRQVRWPSRKDTWKMVLAVFVYTALFAVIITLLDMFFTWLFNLIIK